MFVDLGIRSFVFVWLLVCFLGNWLIVCSAIRIVVYLFSCWIDFSFVCLVVCSAICFDVLLFIYLFVELFVY